LALGFDPSHHRGHRGGRRVRGKVAPVRRARGPRGPARYPGQSCRPCPAGSARAWGFSRAIVRAEFCPFQAPPRSAVTSPSILRRFSVGPVLRPLLRR
jgi:hypothetical protein